MSINSTMTVVAMFENPVGINAWLVLSTLLFSMGLYGVMTRRNAVGILLSIEVLINSSVLNFIIFNRFIAPGGVDGAIQTLFILAVAAAEAVVALAIFVALFKHRQSLDVTEAILGSDTGEAKS